MQYELTLMNKTVPDHFLQADKQLPHAHHIFGTRADTKESTDATIRHYTEQLGPIAHMRQVHGDRIVFANGSGLYEECDALYTDQPRLWLAVKAADCVPVLISTPEAVAVAHCGWRGLEKELLPKLIDKLIEQYDLSPMDMFMHIGPHISKQHYEVEDSFKDIFEGNFFAESEKEGHSLMDLAGIATSQAQDMGVPLANIHNTRRCTFAEDDIFQSYRRYKRGASDTIYAPQLSLICRK